MNYVFPTFITTHMPIGLVGLLIAAIFAAAMSTISAELAALSTATVIDFYRRFVRPDGDDRALPARVAVATGFWGLFASVVAVWAAELGSLIEVVNRFGSFFYGSILGVFILAIGVPARHGERRVRRPDRRHGRRWPGPRPSRTSRSSGTTSSAPSPSSSSACSSARSIRARRAQACRCSAAQVVVIIVV